MASEKMRRERRTLLSLRGNGEKSMNNKIIRIAMLEHGLSQWELAVILGISESQMSRKLRVELPEDEQKRIVSLIERGGDYGDK